MSLATSKVLTMEDVDVFLKALSGKSVVDDIENAYTKKEKDEMIAAMLFNGFNPRLLIKMMFEIASSTGRKLNQDLFKLLLWCALRGPIYREKQINKTDDAGKKIMNEIIAIYKIKTEKSKASDLGSKDITLPRIMASFPWHQAILRIHIKDKGVIPTVVTTDVGLPYHLQFPAAGSLIPAASDLRAKWATWMVEFDKVIQETPSEQKIINKYATAILNSNLFNDTERSQILVSLNNYKG